MYELLEPFLLEALLGACPWGLAQAFPAVLRVEQVPLGCGILLASTVLRPWGS